MGIGKEDLVLCGRQAIDGDTAQVGPQIAEKLHLPQVTYATEIKKDGDKVTVIGLLKESEFFIDEDTVIRGVGILTDDNIVYPKYFGIDYAFQYRQQELNMQKLLRVSEQFADENDPF